MFVRTWLMSEKVDREILNLAWKKESSSKKGKLKNQEEEEQRIGSKERVIVRQDKMPANTNGYTNGNAQHNACILVNGSQRKLSHSYLRYQRRYSKHGWESKDGQLETIVKDKTTW